MSWMRTAECCTDLLVFTKEMSDTKVFPIVSGVSFAVCSCGNDAMLSPTFFDMNVVIPARRVLPTKGAFDGQETSGKTNGPSEDVCVEKHGLLRSTDLLRRFGDSEW